MRVSVIGCGNVGVAIAADLSRGGHDVTIVKTSNRKSVFDKIVENKGQVWLEEQGERKLSIIGELTHDLSVIAESDVIFVTVQSTYHEELIEKMSKYISEDQIVVVICSYMSSFYFDKYCIKPVVVETTGPYLEGRVYVDDRGDVVFKVGCRLTRSPMSMYPFHKEDETLEALNKLYIGFSYDYCTIESGLLNPNMVLHTVGSIMSIPRIELSKGDFCMYREAYARGNDATMRIMLGLDKEKIAVLKQLGCKPIDVFQAGGFLGDPLESFHKYSESLDRAISPTSVRSRYITEDVSQGLVLLESIAHYIGIEVPIATSLIDIASVALDCDFRLSGRTIQRLDAEKYFDIMKVR